MINPLGRSLRASVKAWNHKGKKAERPNRTEPQVSCAHIVKISLWHKQLFRFCMVGVASTTLHILVAFFLLNSIGLSLLESNLGAFFCAFFVSYFGNALWSFESKGEMQSMIRFICAYGVHLLLIVLISNWVTETGLPPYIGILMIALVIPCVGFALQKLWVFTP